ncbi:MAG: glycosyltransferase [Gemmatimonadaceae bacterium]|nr:glycosyltransferase [Gemmatimonadaceae bacterium]MCU0636527.1 glycosyltransferase [Gemmatimonadaceae bacterium]
MLVAVDGGPWVALLLVLLGYVCLAPSLDMRRDGVRALIAGGALCLVVRYLWWRLVDTILPVTPEWTVQYAWHLFFFGTEVALAIEAAVFLLMLSRTLERHDQADANTAWARAHDPGTLPSVDVLIPTYNEGWDVLEKTLVCACALDWPNLRVHLLDDGARDWLVEKCAAYGVNYIRRPDRAHAKAGNINHALTVTDADLVLTFDADFVAQRDFLLRTVGFFQDPAVAVVQVPHHFFNADPLQMNLKLHQQHADDQEFFFGDLMQSRDAWGVAFSCGSNSLIRRTALAVSKGIPTSSITEDILTSVVMLQHGWRTVYLNERLARGLAPEGIAAMYVQRARWARGGIQLLFLKEGPLFAKGLSVVQRLFFLPLSWIIATLGLVVMTAGPLLFLWCDLVAVPLATGDELLQYQVPALVATMLASRHLSRIKRNPLVALAHQTFMAFRLVPAVLHSLVFPFAVGFKVTPKGKLAGGVAIDGRAVAISLATIAATIGGIVVNHLPDYERIPPSAFLTPSLFWGSVTVATMLLCLLMAFEFPRRRQDERFVIHEGHAWAVDGVAGGVLVEDLSTSGAMLDVGHHRPPIGTPVTLHLSDVGRLPATIVRHAGASGVGIAFQELPEEVRRFLIAKIFAHGYENHGRHFAPVSTWRLLWLRLAGAEHAVPVTAPVSAVPRPSLVTGGRAPYRPALDVAPDVLYPRLATSGTERVA